MGSNRSIDEQMFSMKWRTFIPMIFFIIIGTNTVSLTLQRLSNVEEQAEYDILNLFSRGVGGLPAGYRFFMHEPGDMVGATPTPAAPAAACTAPSAPR